MADRRVRPRWRLSRRRAGGGAESCTSASAETPTPPLHHHECMSRLPVIRCRRFLLLAVVVLVAACGRGNPAPLATTFPPAPAGCAGPPPVGSDDHRQRTWSQVREDVERASADDVEIWMSFGKVLTAEEAAALVDDSPVGGVLLAYEVEKGPSVKVTYAPVDAGPTDVATIARAAFDRGHASRQAGGLVPTDPAVASGTPPVVGLRLRAPGERLSTLVSANKCLVYSVDHGQTTGRPVLSPVVAPD